MRIKNVVEKARNAKVNEYYDCGVMDIMEFVNAYKDNPVDLCYEAFKFGYMQGCKAEKKELKDRR